MVSGDGKTRAERITVFRYELHYLFKTAMHYTYVRRSHMQNDNATPVVQLCRSWTREMCNTE